MPGRRRAALGAMLAPLAGLPLAAGAQPPWPSRAIRIIVPFGLGGAADVAARFVAEPLSAALGVPVVIDNKPGAGGVIGTDMAAKSAPDGNTLVALGNTAAVHETLQPARGYVLMRDLTRGGADQHGEQRAGGASLGPGQQPGRVHRPAATRARPLELRA